jgi:hypothetical protein
MDKRIEKLILETMYMVLKNLVEQTDPAVIIAQRIIDVTNAVGTAATDAIQAGLDLAKKGLEESKNAQETIVTNAEIALQTAGSIASAIVNAALNGPLNVPANPENPNSPTVGSLIKFDISKENLKKWVFEIEPELLPESLEVIAEYTQEQDEDQMYIPSELVSGQTYINDKTPGKYNAPLTDLDEVFGGSSDAPGVTVQQLIDLGMLRPMLVGEKVFWKTLAQGGQVFKDASSEIQEEVFAINEEFKNLRELRDALIAADVKLGQIITDLETAVQQLEDFNREAKNTMKKVFNSPFLLPTL